MLLALIVIIVAFTLVHGKRVRTNYSTYQWEDTVFIRHNAATIHSLGDCFTKRPVWPGLYRPLTTNLYYFIGRKAFSNDIGRHHIVNVALTIANAFLLYLVCRNLLPGRWSLVPPAIFASRFSHVEVILNTCEFQTLLSVFFTLLALDLFIVARMRERRLFEHLALVAFILALFSKETALVLPGVLVAFGWLFDEPRAWRHYIAPALAAGIWAALFVVIFRGVSHHEPTGFTYNISPVHVLEGGAAYFLTFFNSLTYRLESIIMVPHVAKAAATDLVKMSFGGLLSAIVAFFVLSRRLRGRYTISSRVLMLGFLFFMIASAPYIILESRLFMRYGYFGHAGLAVAAGAIVRQVTAPIWARMR